METRILGRTGRPVSVIGLGTILNAFRLKPLDEVLPAAEHAGVGIIACRWRPAC